MSYLWVYPVLPKSSGKLLLKIDEVWITVPRYRLSQKMKSVFLLV
jgi:hypothetical protein